MLFSSYSFVLYFLPAVLTASLLLRWFTDLKVYIVFLIAISLFFYAYNNVFYLFLILASIGFNYIVAQYLQHSKAYKKTLLGCGIAANIALLTYYKYTNFLVDLVNQTTDSSLLYTVILPIGISFYTFQQVMYLVDTYKGQIVKHNFSTYALYICFFPQLIAGPIVHQKDFLQQFFDQKAMRNIAENLAIGLSFFAYGLFKKVAIADQLEVAFVNPVFDQSVTGSVTFWEAWVGTTAYAFQIYYDFSGYSDMAFGLGKCFGIELPLNFNSPYKSKSLREFWRRWHITLSMFLRNYLYIPLGGNRLSQARTMINVIVTMFLAGLWHGAGWGFMIWGFLHGVGIAVNHWLQDRLHWMARLSKCSAAVLTWGCTFTFLCLCWVPFRAETVGSMAEIWQAMINVTELAQIKSALYAESHVLVLPLILLHCLFCPNLFQIFCHKLHYVQVERLDKHKYLEHHVSWRPNWFWALSVALAFYISFLLMGTVNSFIYFQF